MDLENKNPEIVGGGDAPHLLDASAPTKDYEEVCELACKQQIGLLVEVVGDVDTAIRYLRVTIRSWPEDHIKLSIYTYPEDKQKICLIRKS